MTDEKNNLDLILAQINELEEFDTLLPEQVKDLVSQMNLYATELKRQKEEMERQSKDWSFAMRQYAEFQKEYSNLFEEAPIGVVVIDQGGIIQKHNRTFLKKFIHLNGEQASFTEHPFEDFVHPESRPIFQLFLQTLNLSGEKSQLEIKLLDLFHTPRDVAVMAKRCMGNRSHYHLAIFDISLQKTREAELVKAQKNAEEANRKKSQFLACLSHELRASLMTIVGFCDLLDIHGLSPKTRQKYIKSIQTAGMMLASLNEEMLDLSLLESGHLALESKNVNIHQMCEDVATFAQGSAGHKNVQIRCQIDQIPILLGDMQRLGQIILSVLSHAIHNATVGTILLRCRFVPNNAEMGILMINVIGDHIFSGENSIEIMSHRLPPPERGGIGLGLYNTSQLLNLMGGKIFWVHPWNSVRIEIPLKISPHPEWNGEETSLKQPFPGTGRTCLLVDDLQENLDVLDAVMQHLGYTTTATPSAKEALNLLTEKYYDAIFTDLWMPEMSGEELAEAIRQNPAYNDIPIYAVTADADYERNFDITLFKSVIMKPITIEKLRQYVVKMQKLGDATNRQSE